MSEIVGAAVILGSGLLVIAGIYQLGKSGNPIVPAASNAYSTTLTSIFK